MLALHSRFSQKLCLRVLCLGSFVKTEILYHNLNATGVSCAPVKSCVDCKVFTRHMIGVNNVHFHGMHLYTATTPPPMDQDVPRYLTLQGVVQACNLAPDAQLSFFAANVEKVHQAEFFQGE